MSQLPLSTTPPYTTTVPLCVSIFLHLVVGFLSTVASMIAAGRVDWYPVGGDGAGCFWMLLDVLGWMDANGRQWVSWDADDRYAVVSLDARGRFRVPMVVFGCSWNN